MYEVHQCQLQQKRNVFFKLPPNANMVMKLKKWLLSLITVNPKSSRHKIFFKTNTSQVTEIKRHIKGPHYFIIHPFSKFNRIREFIFLIAFLIGLMMAPIITAFSGLFTNIAVQNTNFVISIVCFPFHITSILLFFFTGYVKDNTVVLDPAIIAKRYLKGYFMFDVLPLTNILARTEATKYIQILHLFCLVRFVTVTKYLKDMLKDFDLSEAVYTSCYLALVTMFLLNIFTCIFYFVSTIMYAELDFWPMDSWMVTARIDPRSGSDAVKKYLESLRCIAHHFFGVGQGNYKVKSVLHEYFILGFTMIVGRVWTLYMIANLLMLFSIITVSDSKYKDRLRQLDLYVQKTLPSQKMRKRFLTYYKYKFRNHYFNERAILSTISENLREDLMMFEARHLIRNVEMLRHFPTKVVKNIINSSTLIVYLPNDVLVEAGELVDHIYFIATGTVICRSSDNLELAHIEDGDEIGMIGVLTSAKIKHRFTYVALEITEVYCVRKRDFRACVEGYGDILAKFYRKVNERVQSIRLVEEKAKYKGQDFFTELSKGRILELPRMRKTYFPP